MSERTSKYEQFGLDTNPFERTIADEQTAEKYEIVGREDQEARLQDFVRDALAEPKAMKRAMIFGDYGTGKSHHLIQLRDELREGITVNNQEYQAVAAYVGNLGLSIKSLYMTIIDEVRESTEMDSFLDDLPPVEPEESVDPNFAFEQLKENVSENLRRISQEAMNEYDYRSMFIFIDEAEDIVNADESDVTEFVRAFLHIVNDLGAAGIHILLGFSQKAKTRITAHEDEGSMPLGNAIFQRFAQRQPVRLGNLREDEVEKMLIDRLDKHRTSREGETFPVVEDTVEVVTSVTGGHPRAILSVYSDALKYAVEADLDSVNGQSVVYALRGATSFVSDEFLLDPEALTEVEQAIRHHDEDAGKDFENLQGRLIGENAQIEQSAFQSDPDNLLQPLTIGGEELRVLERLDKQGRYYYRLHDDIKDFIFGSEAGKGPGLVADLDIKATQAPDKYQGDMSRGLAMAMRNAQLGTVYPDPVTIQQEEYPLEAWLVDFDLGEGFRNPTIALAVYNGPSIPKGLVELFVKAIGDREATFGILIKEGQQESGEANKYLREIEGTQAAYYKDRVIKLDLTPEHRDNYAYGMLLGLGDTSVEIEEEGIDPEAFINSLNIQEQLEERVTETVLPYPDKIGRAVVEELEQDKGRKFTITGLRERLDLQSFELRSETMKGYREQGLVAKTGQNWVYPDVEEDRPPWYQAYAILKNDGPKTREELQAELESQFVLQCPAEDRGEMIQWYLNRLNLAGYINTTKDGGTVRYEVVSVVDQLDDALEDAREKFEKTESHYERAKDLEVSNLNEHRNSLDDLKATLNEKDGLIDPDHSDLRAVRQASSDLTELRDELKEVVHARIEELEGEVDNFGLRVESFAEDIEEAEAEGIEAEEFREWELEAKELHETLEQLKEAESYGKLISKLDSANSHLDELEGKLEQFINIKGVVKQQLQEARSTRKEIAATIEGISSRNSQRETFSETLEDYRSELDLADQEYSAGSYEAAREKLDQLEPELDRLLNRVNEVLSDQERLRDKLTALKPRVEGASDSELRDINTTELRETYESAVEAVEKGKFGEAEGRISDIEDALEGPTEEERFHRAIEHYEGSLKDITANTDFSRSRVFQLAEQLLANGEVDDVKLV